MTNAVIDDSVSARSGCLASNAVPATFFARAGRDDPDAFRRKTLAVQNVPFLQQALDAMPSIVVILNDNRQIVAANETLLTMLDTAVCNVLAKRPGEAIRCIRERRARWLRDRSPLCDLRGVKGDPRKPGTRAEGCSGVPHCP